MVSKNTHLQQSAVHKHWNARGEATTENKYIKTSSVHFTACRGDIKSYWPYLTKYNKQTTSCTRKGKFNKKNIKRKLQEKNKELKEKHEEKQEKLEELEKRCKKLELQHTELFNEMTNLTAQNKDLQELCLQKKKKHFRFFMKKDSAASLVQPGKE